MNVINCHNVLDYLLLTADSCGIVHNLNTCIRLYQHSQFSITLPIHTHTQPFNGLWSGTTG